MSFVSHNTDIKAASQDAAFSVLWFTRFLMGLWVFSVALILMLASQTGHLVPAALWNVLVMTTSTFGILAVYYLWLKFIAINLNAVLVNLQFLLLGTGFILYSFSSVFGYYSGGLYIGGYNPAPFLTGLNACGIISWLLGTAAFLIVLIEALVVKRRIGDRDTK